MNVATFGLPRECESVLFAMGRQTPWKEGKMVSHPHQRQRPVPSRGEGGGYRTAFTYLSVEAGETARANFNLAEREKFAGSTQTSKSVARTDPVVVGESDHRRYPYPSHRADIS